MSEPAKAPPPIKIASVPSYSAKKMQGSFFGRLVVWILAFLGKKPSKVETEAEKAERIFDMETVQKQKETRDVNFQKNLQTLKKLTAENLVQYKVVEGKFVKVFEIEELPETKRAERKVEVMDLIHQTYRQLWGQMIDADYGFRVKAEVQKEFDSLKQHLSNEFPEVLKAPGEMPGSPLKILSTTYRLGKTKGVPKKILAAREKSERKITEKISELLAKEKIIKETPDRDIRGAHPVEFIKKEGAEGYLAVEKSMSDSYYGHAMALADHEKNRLPKDKYAILAGVNEIIASGLDLLVGGIFGVPLTTFSKGKTIHSFQENVGTYSEKIKPYHAKDPKAKDKFIKKMPIIPSQRFVLIQIAMGNWDCHANNILIGKDKQPIPIDFGRSLGIDPNLIEDHLRAAFLDWPAMDQPLSVVDREIFKKLDIDDVIEKLKDMLRAHPDRSVRKSLEDPAMQQLISKQLDRLKAHLYVIKEGARRNLTPRQMMALFFPPISETEDARFKFQANEAGYTKEKLERLKNATVTEKLHFYRTLDGFISHRNENGFIWAWNESVSDGKLNIVSFRHYLKAELDTIQELPQEELFTEREKFWYGVTGFYDAF